MIGAHGQRQLQLTEKGAQVAKAASPYIVSPAYDWIFFLIQPALALGLGIAISGTSFADAPITTWAGEQSTLSALLIGMVIHAHLVIVFLRSHANEQIFKLYPMRFIAIPLLLYAGMLWSSWVLVSASVLATFWDVYHSALQTFGFSRIYDGRVGNAPDVGRRLDWWLNQLLYCGPILAGVTMIDHFEDFEEFGTLDSTAAAFFTQVPALMQGHQAYLTWSILIAGSLFLVYYVASYVRLYRSGYAVSFPKVYLLTSTGLCSLFTWGLNSWGEAFFIMNLFHAVQYFGIVWAREQGNLARRLGVAAWRSGKYVALLAFLLFAFSYGAAAEVFGGTFAWFWPATLVVSLMHFWYDGFIWSVRRKQV